MALETFVGFVRAVMIGREGLHRTVLLDVCREAGVANPVSYIATGNLSFEADPAEVGDQVADIERRIEAIVGRPTPVFMRTPAELRALIASDPFRRQPLEGDHERTVSFLLDRVPGHLELPIWSPAGDVVVFAASDRELFTSSAKRNGMSNGAGGMIERRTGQRVTSRVWSTIERIVAKLA